MLSTTLTTKGQIVIPKEIRDLLLLHEGIKILIEVENGKIILHPSGNKAKLSKFRKKVRSKMTKPVTDEDIRKTKEEVWLQ